MLLKCLVLPVLLVGLLARPAIAQKTMTVQSKQGDVRESASMLSKVVGTVANQAQVTVLEEKAPWVRVSATTPAGAVTGWMHTSALSTKAAKMTAGGKEAPSSVSSGEMAMANKGFDAQVEADFRKSKNVDYTWVDKMEQIKIPPEKMKEFLSEGNIAAAKGESK